jgi:hypothetical protein
LPDFAWRNVPKLGKICPKDTSILKIITEYANGHQNIPKFSIPWPSKIYQSRDIWLEKIPSGNPARAVLLHL